MGEYLRTMFRTRGRTVVSVASAILMVGVTTGLRLLLMEYSEPAVAAIVPSALMVAWLVWIGAQVSRWRQMDRNTNHGS